MLALIRYWLAVLLVVAIPTAILYWLLIHPFARFWRRFGVGRAYTAVGAILLPVMAGLFLGRGRLLAHSWGTNRLLVALGIICLVGAGWLHRWLFRDLPLRVLLGIPELSAAPGKGTLITTGIYGTVRHPRYLQMDLALLGYALIANYPAVYLLYLLWLAGIRLVVALEERELEARFGEEYRRYRERVPRFIPRRRR